jgi:hypothetical protein
MAPIDVGEGNSNQCCCDESGEQNLGTKYLFAQYWYQATVQTSESFLTAHTTHYTLFVAHVRNMSYVMDESTANK